MTTDTPSSNDKVSSPLHLLQTLTRTLNEHLAEACSTAEKDARKAHEKLLRQQEKLELKLRQAEEKPEYVSQQTGQVVSPPPPAVITQVSP